MTLRWFRVLVGLALLVGWSSAAPAGAATLVIEEGELVGATGVLVDGTLYDVEFQDGTCAALYDGCDETSDFPFPAAGAANKASLALLGQVFLGTYDDDPELTRGCENIATCTLTTPFGPLQPMFQASGAVNEAAPSTDGLDFFQSEDGDSTGAPRFVFAVWTLVCSATPDPSCQTGFGSGSFSVTEHKPGKEKLRLKLAKGPAIAPADFGDPSAPEGTRYSLCVFDEGGDRVAALQVDRAGDTCGAKPCWKVTEGKRAAYKDPAASASGVRSIKLSAGDAGKSKISISAANNAKKGQDSLPTGIAESLSASTSVRVELHTSDAACFAATLDEVKANDPDRFKAK
ncbi:MAG: hypothetical protein ABFS41_05845 [Myxococcota bacterium]